MSHLTDLEYWLDHASEKVKRGTTIVTPTEMEQDYFLHISTNTNIRQFIPIIGQRQGNLEDRSVPRVCVAPSLLGCLMGYSKAEYDFMEHASTGKEDDDFYKGGWKIYVLPFQAALKPNKSMVPDAKATDEHWLVAYNKDTAAYVPETAGRCFFHTIRYIGRSKDQPRGEGTLYCEVTKEGGIAFSPATHLAKGYWKIEGPIMRNVESTRHADAFGIHEISKADYLAAKNQVAALLSHAEPPAYLFW